MMRKGIRRRVGWKWTLASFSLVELLMVMTIIALLAGLILAAGTGLMNKAARSRASAEIAAMGAAAESYKNDNGIYPQSDGVLSTNSPYTAYDGSSLYTAYQTNSTLLFIALSGQTNMQYAPASGTKAYMSFKPNQIGNASGAYSYIKDPWNYSYAYSTGGISGTTNYAPLNGTGFFDLWSTGGVTQAQYAAKNSLTNTWISNWQ